MANITDNTVDASENTPHSVWADFQQLLRLDQERQDLNHDLLRHYVNRSGVMHEEYPGANNDSYNKTYNITKSVVNTAAIKIGKARPKPTPVTRGGDWHLRDQAKKLDQYLQGQFQNLRVHEMAPLLAIDACHYGTGIWHWYRVRGRIRLERVYINEIVVDPREAIYRQPRRMFRHKRVDREVLKNMYPDKANVIDWLKSSETEEQIASELGDDAFEAESISDTLTVVSRWVLPSGENSGDGTWCTLCEGVELESGEWKHSSFPFTFFHWTLPRIGFWGQGLAEDVVEIDRWVNHMMSRMRTSARKGAVPIMIVEEGSLSSQEHEFSNDAWTILEKAPGSADPHSIVPTAVGAELMQLVASAKQEAYEITGVSVLSAQAKKPSGLDSRVALREFNDIESERFIDVGRRFEQAVAVDAARHIVRLSKEIAEDESVEESDLTTQLVDGRNIIDVSWGDIQIEDDAYVLQVFPTSSLPESPPARFAAIEERMQAGLIDPEEGRELMDMPDLQAHVNRATAPRRIIEKVIEKALEEKKFIPPEAYFPLELGIKKVQEAYTQGVIDEVPDDRLQLLREWITAAEAQIERAALKALPTPKAEAEAGPEQEQLPLPFPDAGASVPPFGVG